MKAVFASFEHSRVGFPKVKLKFSEDASVGDGYIDPYVTVNGIIQEWNWSPNGSGSKKIILPRREIEDEIKKFESWVVLRFGDDISVQG